MQAPRLTDAEALDRAFAAPRFLLFKHSTRCPISARAFTEYRSFVEQNPEVATGWIDVIQDRDLSQEVARRTGVGHESPQAFVLEAGEAAWTASHSAITHRALEASVSPSTEPGSGDRD